MARRISSIFSMGSDSSGHSSNDARSLSTLYPEEPSKRIMHGEIDRRSTPDLRSSNLASRTQGTQHSPDGRRTPQGDPTRQSPQVHSMMLPPLYALEEDGGLDLLHPPDLRKPVPEQRSGSPIGSRPATRGSGADSRPASKGSGRDHSAPHSRAASPSKLRPVTPTGETSRSPKRMSWIPGRLRSDSRTEEFTSPLIPPGSAWLLAPHLQNKTHYNLSPLINFQPIPELWNESGDIHIYLHAREGGHGPSFKIDSSLFAASTILATAAHGVDAVERKASLDQTRLLSARTSALKLDPRGSPDFSPRGSSDRSSSAGGRSNLNDSDVEEKPKAKDLHMCIPLPLRTNIADPNLRLSSEDIEVLVAMRNFFAFLSGQPLVATSKRPSLYLVFLEIAEVLHRYRFTNLDGSTLGEEVYLAFSRYVLDFGIADVRSSREKTIEAIILGERMKHWPLFNEGFVHAIGKFDDLVQLQSPKYILVTALTRKKMERAALDLSIRLRNVRARLEDFDFPALFAGIANSRSSSERKVVRFNKWKDAYMLMRSHVLSFYKRQYGAWPPKARSRKNDFEQSGLNRLLLREVYADFSDLYDLLVDRKAITTRHANDPAEDFTGDASADEPTPRALRRVLDEYDRSTPPVQPPIPFDIPRLPSLTITRTGHVGLEPSKRKRHEKKRLPDDEIRGVTMGSYNNQSLKGTPFIMAFGEFERRQAHGKSLEDIVDLRIGQWIFMYVVIQALPLVVVDAPGLQHTDSVEYFLCEVPKGSPPWVQESNHQKQNWYGIAGGTGMVSLPADIVEHGVDGVYHRSHCWTKAEQWAEPSESYPTDEPLEAERPYPRSDYLPEPQYTSGGYLSPAMSDSRPQSRADSRSPTRSPRRSSIALGLEQLPMPQRVAPSGSRPVSVHDPTKTFNSIMAAGGQSPSQIKGKKI